MARQRKHYLLRIPHDLYDVYEAWAADEFRSVNAQMEAVLVDAARRARRVRKPPEDEGSPDVGRNEGGALPGTT